MVTGVQGVLAGLLHMGNLTFAGDESSSITSADAIKLATQTLGCDLTVPVTNRSLTVGGEKTMVPLTPAVRLQ